MTGRLLIDDVDVYTEYCVCVAEGGFNELAAFPALKEIDKNDWHEYDGIEPDLSAPVLNTKDVQMSFFLKGSVSNYISFIELLTNGVYHTFECLGREWTLRLVNAPNHRVIQPLELFTLKFADDYPLNGYSYLAPSSTVRAAEDYKIDNKKFTDYGVRILEGSLAEVLKAAPEKQNLLRNIPSQSGVIYDGLTVKLQSKDVKLNCLMRASTLSELWRNHNALLYDLIRPNERLLYVSHTNKSYKCYYKNSTVKSFYPDDKIWLEFTLTLTFTRDFR